MRIILLIFLFLIISSSANAATYYARLDGGTTVQCTGQTNAPYDGSGTGENCAYANLQDAVNAVQFGDILIARATDSWGQIILPIKVGTPSIITVKSSNEASIPVRLHGVTNADAVNMAKIATVNNDFAISAPSGTGHWKFIGFEITTANRSQYYQNLIINNGENIDFDRCWIHSLEDYTDNPEASCRIGITYFGNNSDVTNSRISYFSAYALGTTIVDNNFALIYGGSNMTIDNSFMGAWFDVFISGGFSFPPLIENVTVSGTPTLNSATISNVTGITVGTLMAFRNYPQRELTNACSFTASTKTLVCTGGNFNAAYKDLGGAGTPAFFFPSLGFGTGIETVVNSTTLITQSDLGGSNFSNLTVQIDGVYGAVKVDSISGNDITFTPHGITALQAPPEVPGNVQWGGTVPSNLTISKTEMFNDPEIAATVFATTAQNPKAFWEVKAIDGLIIDGVVFTGFGTSMGFLVANQGTPAGCPSVWTRINNVQIKNSFYNTSNHEFQAMGFSLTKNYYCTSSGGFDITVSNNLIGAGGVFSRLVAGVNIDFVHNTIINNGGGPQLIQHEAGSSADDTIQFNYTDNIAFQNTYGINCSYGTMLGCVPSSTINTNLFIGPSINGPYCGAGYPAGNACVADITAAKFINPATKNYRLQNDSPAKGTGTGGTDMGANWTDLINALGFDPSGAITVTKCHWHTTPPCITQ